MQKSESFIQGTEHLLPFGQARIGVDLPDVPHLHDFPDPTDGDSQAIILRPWVCVDLHPSA